VLDTTFFTLHYFSQDPNVLERTKAIIRSSRRLGSRGLIPVIVLAEFYALARKRAGRDVAEKYFSEIKLSGLELVSLNVAMARQAGILRAKYHEKVPWGDCLIAAVAIENKADIVVTEDPHFHTLKEIRTKNTSQVPV
jgi:predicted nucleic acid-binding protein